MMITQETCVAIWSAYREIEAGEKLLEDMKTVREREHKRAQLAEANELARIELGI